MPQFFSTSRVKASSFSMFCWMWSWACLSRGMGAEAGGAMVMCAVFLVGVSAVSGVVVAAGAADGRGASRTQGVSRPKSTRMWPFCS